MKKLIWALILVANICSAFAVQEYPLAPHPRLTPGELCDRPSRYRYPENIAYCERDVVYELKEQVFANYRRLGYRLDGAQRSSYKIDHYIPLCAGGSNNAENLWPQHIQIGSMTDSIEKLGCDKMALGRLTQAKFISIIKRVKNDLRQVNAVNLELSRL